MGLRHDFYPPVTPRLQGGFSNYDSATNSLVVAGYGDNPMNLGRKTYYTDFAPRFGLAYRLNSKTVLRGGFGISWIPFPDNKYAWDNYPVKQSNTYNALSCFGQAQTAPGVYGSMATGFPAPQPARDSVQRHHRRATRPICCRRAIAGVIPLDYREGYIQAWNLALQRQLPKNFTHRGRLCGQPHGPRAGRLQPQRRARPSIPARPDAPCIRSSARTRTSTLRYAGYSNNYNSLQVKVDRRFSGGFLMTTAYTYGKGAGLLARNRRAVELHPAPAQLLPAWTSTAPTTSFRATCTNCRSARASAGSRAGVGRWVLGDWQLNGVLSLMTGRPLTFGTTVSPNTPGTSLTPDQIGPIKRSP